MLVGFVLILLLLSFIFSLLVIKEFNAIEEETFDAYVKGKYYERNREDY